MIKNYLKIAFRNFAKQGKLAGVNLFGLSIGLTVSFYLFIYAWQHLSFDKFHSQSGSIYRVLSEFNHQTGTWYSNLLKSDQSYELDQSLPFLILSTDLAKEIEVVVQSKSESFYDEHFYLTDSNFFKVFDFQLIYGTHSEVLKSPANILISEKVAIKYFGKTQVLGKEITVNQKTYFVEGVLKETHHNSHLNINFLAVITPQITESKLGSSWLSKYFISNTSSNELLNAGINNLLKDENWPWRYYVQSIEDIHLKTNPELYDYSENSDIKSIYIVISIAILILATASFNFMNLLLATYLRRLKEIGIRKIQGARSSQLILQLFLEAFLWTTISILMAGLLLELSTPSLNSFLSYEVAINYTSWKTLIFFGFFLLTLPLLAATYPSLYVISASKTQLISKTEAVASSEYRLTRSLVLLQCFVAILLLVGSAIVKKQTDYLNKKERGIRTEGILTIDLENKLSVAEYQALSQKLRMLPEVKDIAAGPLPGRTMQLPIKSKSGETFDINIAYVMGDYLSLLEAKIIEGKNIDQINWKDKVLVNRTALSLLGLEGNGVGEEISYNELNLTTHNTEFRRLEVIGLIEDYHFENLKMTIAPLIIEVSESKGLKEQLGISFETTNLSGLIGAIKNQWDMNKPDIPFSYELLEDRYDNFQAQENRLADGLGYVTGLSIILSLIGLFSLSHLELSGRFKEISIKKILGASSRLLARQYLMNYLKIVWVAAILSIPLAYYFTNDWLATFSYKAGLSAISFAAPVILISILTGICVLVNIWTATSINPVENLRKES